MQSTRAPSEPSSSSSSSSSLTQPPCQPHRRVLSCQSPQSQSPQSPLSPSPSLVRKQQQPPPPPPPHRCFRRLHLQTTVTPWIDPIEFERVGRALLQAQYLPVGRRQLTRHHHPHHHECPPAPVASTTFTAALERVAIWRLRSGGGADHLPHWRNQGTDDHGARTRRMIIHQLHQKAQGRVPSNIQRKIGFDKGLGPPGWRRI